jgi:sulfate/thiosulfate transport system ATP-binding protein
MTLEIRSVSKSFGRFPALDRVSFEIEDGEFIALLGPSGSGKTTLLRVLAGLEMPDAGAVMFRGENLLATPVRQRGVGMVFQHYALFRHMTVAQNIAFGMLAKPRRTRPSPAAIEAKVAELLATVQLDGLGSRYPSQLSGGQRQRVALARALAIDPKILLLDEPFGALDAKVRRELRRWLRDIHERTGLTTIFVTHDQEEALELADRVAVLKDGTLQQYGAPDELYHDPANPFVFDFLGDTVEIACSVEAGVAVVHNAEVAVLGELPADGQYTALTRPAAMSVRFGEGPGLRARVRKVLTAGPASRAEFQLDGGRVIDVPLSPAALDGLAPQARVRLVPGSVRIWDGAPGVARGPAHSEQDQHRPGLS